MSTATADAFEPAWTLQDVARYLRVHPATISVWLKEGGRIPPPRRVGLKYLWDPTEIRALLAPTRGE